MSATCPGCSDIAATYLETSLWASPVCCLPESCPTAHPAKRIANATPAINFSGFMVCAFFACAPRAYWGAPFEVDSGDINPNVPSTEKVPVMGPKVLERSRLITTPVRTYPRKSRRRLSSPAQGVRIPPLPHSESATRCKLARPRRNPRVTAENRRRGPARSAHDAGFRPGHDYTGVALKVWRYELSERASRRTAAVRSKLLGSGRGAAW